MIPEYQEIMLPLLELADDEEEHRFRDAVDELAKDFNLTEEQRNKLLPSGTDKIFRNRVGWAKTYLKKAGLLEYPERGYFKITERGKEVLERDPDKIDYKFLKKFEGFKEFVTPSKGSEEPTEEIETSSLDDQTPEELIEIGYKTLTDNLAEELLEKIRDSSPEFFEKLVVDLLVKMGYGGSIKEAGEAIGKVGDEGIDGVIKEDFLGLDIIYLQAKRWQNTVPRPEVQKFAGALQGKNAKKGVFITTSSFSKNARRYADKIDSKLILINGEKLANLMIKHDVGVSLSSTYIVKDVDSDYFLE